MKKTPVILFLAILASVTLAVADVQATVGGPTYVYNLRISHVLPIQEIMYVTHSLSGKGCPPSVSALNIETMKSRDVVACDFDADESVMERAFSQFPVVLKRLHLPYSGMRAETRVVRFTENKDDPFQFQKTDFETKIYQNTYDGGEREVAAFDYPGCYPDQRHIIEGYATPQGYLVAFVVSTIGDCFEGGYITERIFPIKAMRVSDDPITLEPRAASEPATVDADTENGNLLAIAKSQPDAPWSGTYAIIGLLLIGILILAIRRR